MFLPNRRVPTLACAALAAAHFVCLQGVGLAAEPQRPDLDLLRARQELLADENQAAIDLLTGVIAASDLLRAPALFLRAVAHYQDANQVLAEIDALAALAIEPNLDDLARQAGEEGTPPGASPYILPADFLIWVEARYSESRDRAQRSESATRYQTRRGDVGNVSLEDLFPDREIREVTSHFVMDVEVVRIPVIVQGIEGGFLPGLTADIFQVSEGSSLPHPVADLIPESEPTSVGILVDASAAMRPFEAEVRRSVENLARSLRREDEMFLIQFGDSATFLSSFTRNPDEIASAMANYQVQEDRALYDAVALGLIQMRSSLFDKKALIVISNGDDTSSQTVEADIRRAAQQEAIAIYAMVMTKGVPRWRPTGEDGGTVGRAQRRAGGAGAPNAGDAGTETFVLQELVHNTGGLVALRPAVGDEFGDLADWLDITCGTLAAYVNNQYLLLYESPDPPPRGVWRRLRVSVSVEFSRIRSRPGYVR